MHISTGFASGCTLGTLVLGILFTVVAASAQDVPTQAEQDVPTQEVQGEEWTLESYQRSLKAMEQFFGEIEVEGNLRDEVHLSANSTRLDEAKIIYGRSAGALKMERWNGDAAVVWCRNPERYVFKVIKDATNSSFALSERHPASFPISDSNERYAFRCLDASHAIQGIPISTLIESPDFRITAVEDESDSGSRVVHITYTFAPKDEISILSDGELWLAPGKNWAVLKSVSQVDYRNSKPRRTGHSVTEVRYQDALQDGIAIPSEVTISSIIGKNFSRVEHFVFTKLVHGKVDSSEFTLTRYKLPEIEEVAEGRRVNSRLRWVFAINLGFVIVLGYLFFVRKVRRRSTNGGQVNKV